MSRTNETPKHSELMVGKNQIIKRIITFFKSLENGNHDITDDILTDLDSMWDCTYCNRLQNNFWCHMLPMQSQVVVTCRFISPVSLLTFFVVRQAKLSLHRLKNSEFNDDEWMRIRDALQMLADTDLAIYDVRHADGGNHVELDNSVDFAHVAF
jgi:hypothetical protein